MSQKFDFENLVELCRRVVVCDYLSPTGHRRMSSSEL